MADEVQINANDLLVAFGAENASLIQRVIIAELRAKSLQTALTSTREELAAATQASVVDNGEGSVPTSGQPLP